VLVELVVFLSVNALVLFQVLRAFECLWADCTCVWLEWGVDCLLALQVNICCAVGGWVASRRDAGMASV
jgi:hypothetical protein